MVEVIHNLLISIFPDFSRSISIFLLGLVLGFISGVIYTLFQIRRTHYNCPRRSGHSMKIPVVKNRITNKIYSVDCVYCKNKLCKKDETKCMIF